MTVSGTNFGKAAADYGRFRAGFPDSIFDRLSPHGVGLSGQVVVDLGTGTGTLARGFALRGCTVFGIDPDARMLTQARELDEAAGAQVSYLRARAESTGLDGHSADVVIAGQCWHWFDRSRALEEVRRVLKPDGALVIAHFDWLPLEGSVVADTEALIQRHNPDWNMGGGMGMHPQWLPGLSAAGLEDIETFSYDLMVRYPAEAWRGRIRASAGIVALDPAAAARFDEEHGRMLADKYPPVLETPHRVFAIISRFRG